MAPARSATAAMLLGAAAGCGVGAEQPPALMMMSPAQAYDEVAVPAEIYGRGFRPAYRFDTGSGSTALEVSGFGATLVADPPLPTGGSYPLTGVMWESDTILGVEIPAGVPAGGYDLVVADPGGHTARKLNAFTSLGPDVTPPLVQVSSPSDGGVVAAGATVAVVVSADDGLGVIAKLEVSVTTTAATIDARDCPVAGGGTASCTYTIVAPQPATDHDSLTVTVVATDGAGLISKQQATLALLGAPSVTGISPASGSTLGGTAVTLSGANFVAGLTQVAFDGQPGTIISSSVTPTSLSVTTPAHVAGPAVVTLVTAGASATLDRPFKFVAPPSVREVDPISGPAAGYIAITIVGESFTSTTRITFNGTPLLCPTFVNVNRIQGLVPPGAGTEAVFATDPVGGTTAYGSVPFNYIGGAPPGPTDAGLADAAPISSPPPPDAGCPGSGAP